MRITLLTPGTGHFYCGSCLRDNSLAKALYELGHDVVQIPLYLPFFLEEEESDEPVRMGGINVYLQQKLPILGRMPGWMARLLDSPGLLRWASKHGDMTDAAALGAMTVSMLRGEEGRHSREVERLVAQLGQGERPDVICLSNVMLSGIARRLKAELGVPIACTLQGEAPFLDALPEPYRSESWEILNARKGDIDAFIPVSDWYGRFMAERLGLAAERVHVVHNGIDLRSWGIDPRSPGIDAGSAGIDARSSNGSAPAPRAAGPPTIGYLARMCEDKGLHTLVDAFLLLAERGSIEGLRLRVSGVLLKADEPWLDGLKARLEEAGLLDRVDFLPNIDRAAKLDFLRTLSVLSVPATYGESFGLYLLEALASGVPVVQPRHGAFPEILEATGGGRLCEPDDPVSLADELEAVLSDEAGSAEMGERGRRAVHERFGVERMARGVADVCTLVAARA